MKQLARRALRFADDLGPIGITAGARRSDVPRKGRCQVRLKDQTTRDAASF